MQRNETVSVAGNLPAIVTRPTGSSADQSGQ